jgi:ribosome maturation factor RimP
MINKTDIEKTIADYLQQHGLFLVEIAISKENDIEIAIESKQNSVTLENCEEIDSIVQNKFNRDEQDYSLTVGSAGLDQPFKVPGQYLKFIGQEVELLQKAGKKIKGTLSGYSDNVIEITTESLEKVEGKKRKERVEHSEKFTIDSIKYCKPVIKFK